MSPVYDDSNPGDGQTTLPEQLLALIYALETAAAHHASLMDLIARLLQTETVEARRDYLDTLALMARKADFTAARAFMDEETF